MRKTFTQITTHDTKKTYVFPPEEGENNPQLWEVELKIRHVNSYGNTPYEPSGEISIFVERATLANANMLPILKEEPKDTPVKARTPEDLILELLEIIGIYPQN
ncbi:MAG: hypothetical protein MIO92_11405 [Methanosarcinaceae archaeon]|nr:hypothetical protein [Methanosarcinaceae archaeon]